MNKPGRYTKRPVTIEAMQWDGTNTEAVKAFVGERQKRGLEAPLPTGTGECGFLLTEEISGGERSSGAVVYDRFHDWIPLAAGDWIIRGLKGEFYPCQPEVFAASYGPAEDGADA